MGASSILAARRWALAWVMGCACAVGASPGCSERDESHAAPVGPGPDISAVPDVESPPTTTCDHPIPVYAGGQHTRDACPDDVIDAGLTVVDLSDRFVPEAFSVPPGSPPLPYRNAIEVLENERWNDGAEWDRARSDRYLELYGIFPSISVVARRMEDEARHACRRAIADDDLGRLQWETDPWKPLVRQRAEVEGASRLRAQLDAERSARALDSIDALAGDPIFGRLLDRYRRIHVTSEAVRAMQAHLRCEGLLEGKVADGLFDERTTSAMQAYQRKEMIVGWRLDAETAGALLADPLESDFRALLRTLRERVVDATGLIEDGSALGRPGLVAGRVLDSEAFRGARGHAPHPAGAPDLVAAATDAAATALGWTGPEEARRFLRALPPGALEALRVALPLPPPPAYHSPHMQLRVEVDRGDVVYESPYSTEGSRLAGSITRRPAITIYAANGEGETALVRWGTTIGGWQPERIPGQRMGMRYKESPVGPRVWRDIVATPAWIPPESAPRRDLVRPRTGGGWAIKDDLFGPSYASAYGLVMFVHHRETDGGAVYDEGIRTHGSVKYDSIHHGESHGCHRIHNHRAVRLAGFLLEHRNHELVGPMKLGYARSFSWYQKTMTLKFDSRGYRYELTPPVPVEVVKGRILGRRTQASTVAEALPSHLQKRFAGEMLQP